MKPEKKADRTKYLLWGIYLCLLGVLLPHTAWLFGSFEPDGTLGLVTGWAGALAFEAAIAVLTHKLAQHWERAPVRQERWKTSGWVRLRYWYGNAYLAGLAVSVGVSSLANLAHAVEYGRALQIFARWGIEPPVYQVAVGAVLPIASLLFAAVLSNTVEVEDAPNPDLEKAKADLLETRRALRASEDQRRAAEEARARSEQERANAEQRFAAAGDLLAGLMQAEKRQRILAVNAALPKLQPGEEIPLSLLALVSGASVAYVSEVLSSRRMVEVEQ